MDVEGWLYTWGGDGQLMLGHSDKFMEASVNVIPARLAAQKKMRDAALASQQGSSGTAQGNNPDAPDG